MNSRIIAAKQFTKQTLALFSSEKDSTGVYQIPASAVHALAQSKMSDANKVLPFVPEQLDNIKPTLTNRVHSFLKTFDMDQALIIMPSSRDVQEIGDEDLDYATFATADDENDNCLAGFRCPECGEQDRFQIAIQSFADFDDTGSEVNGDCEFDGQSSCLCCNCKHSGVVNDFYTLHDE